jgi:hypothetical protein
MVRHTNSPRALHKKEPTRRSPEYLGLGLILFLLLAVSILSARTMGRVLTETATGQDPDHPSISTPVAATGQSVVSALALNPAATPAPGSSFVHRVVILKGRCVFTSRGVYGYTKAGQLVRCTPAHHPGRQFWEPV